VTVPWGIPLFLLHFFSELLLFCPEKAEIAANLVQA